MLPMNLDEPYKKLMRFFHFLMLFSE